MDFVVPVDNRVNLKESKKGHEYAYLARELKKIWNLKVTVIPVEVSALGTIPKGLIRGLKTWK